MLKRHHLLIIIILSFVSSQSYAILDPIRIAILVSADSGAPTPESVVEHGSGSITRGFSQSPLAALTTAPPTKINYLLQKRAAGDFKSLLVQTPNSARSKLERYLLLEYSGLIDVSTTLSVLQNDQYIDAAIILEYDITLSSASGTNAGTGTSWNSAAINIENARDFARGHSWIATIDTGIQENHPDLISTNTNNQFAGGNFISHLSFDLAAPSLPGGLIDPVVDELRPVPTDRIVCDQFDGTLDGMMSSSFAGHGTHVAGIMGSKYSSTLPGICVECSLLIQKVSQPDCPNSSPIPFITVELTTESIHLAMTLLADIGAAAYNMSFGVQSTSASSGIPLGYCQNIQPNDPWCLAIQYSAERDQIMIGAAGNQISFLQFPARDERIIAVGGINESLTFWDDRPDCPLSGNAECGSNFSFTGINSPKTDIVTPAKNVPSLFYEGMVWNRPIGCTDDEDGVVDGFGPCTGTSMSAPHVTGLVGILRSINPLVRTGDGDPTTNGIFVTGIRDVLNETSSVSTAGMPHDIEFGYGIPDAEAAVKRMLGTVDNTQMVNRLTPLFAQFSTGADDTQYTISPQIAYSFAFNQANNYTDQIGSPIPQYQVFPGTPNLPPPSPAIDPAAQLYVFSTYRNPYGTGELTPLYRLTFEGVNPDCEKNCNQANRDMVYAISESEINAFLSVGYRYEGIEGYLLPVCNPEPTCIPTSAVKVLRRYNPQLDDHAVFPESELSTMIANGYTSISLAGVLGYAYPADIDTDGDQLIDGIEYLIGTNATIADSDCDGINDGAEYPLVGVPVSDPLDGNCTDVDIEVNIFGQGTTSNPAVLVFTNNGPATATNAEFRINLRSADTLPGTLFSFDHDQSLNCQAVDPGPVFGQFSSWECLADSISANTSVSVTMVFCGPKTLDAKLIRDGNIAHVDQTETDPSNDDITITGLGIECGGGLG